MEPRDRDLMADLCRQHPSFLVRALKTQERLCHLTDASHPYSKVVYVDDGHRAADSTTRVPALTRRLHILAQRFRNNDATQPRSFRTVHRFAYSVNT